MRGYVSILLCGKKNLLLIVFFSSLISLYTHAATVDTVSIYSPAMKISNKCIVILPDDKNTSYPTLYLLHGYDGSYRNWITRVPELKDHAEHYKLIIVCPEGKNSWYFDSQLEASSKYETHVSTEVPEYIDKHYPTIKDRKARAITGLSMGGHGSLFIAFRRSDLFGACGSMSGVLDLKFVRNKYGLTQLIGDTLSETWKTHSVYDLIDKKPTDTLAILIDCGIDDLFFPINRKIHEKMLQLKILHDYVERPGNHNWNYWRNAIKFQILFFINYFRRDFANKAR